MQGHLALRAAAGDVIGIDAVTMLEAVAERQYDLDRVGHLLDHLETLRPAGRATHHLGPVDEQRRIWGEIGGKPYSVRAPGRVIASFH